MCSSDLEDMANGQSVQNWFDKNVAAPIFDAAGNVLGWVAGEVSQYGIAPPSVTAPVANAIGVTIGTLYSGSQQIAEGAQGSVVEVFNAAGQPIGQLALNALGLFQELILGVVALAAVYVVANDST